jgi:CheY-like chemotaxis protein
MRGWGWRILARVYVADDAPAVRSLIRHLLEQMGEFEVVGETGDGLIALNQIFSLMPDVAILDLNMPGLDGLAIVEALHKRGAPPPVIVCTSDPSPSGPMPTGVVSWITKPFHLGLLKRAILAAIGQRDAHQ